MSKFFPKIIMTVIVLIISGIFWLTRQPETRDAGFITRFKPAQSDYQTTPFFRELSASDGRTREFHAASAFYSESTDELHAYWYGGTREGASDVCIYTSIFYAEAWSASRQVICPDKVQADTWRFTRKVGNAVPYLWPDGEIWLFFVSVSVGGWGGSSINMITSGDMGKTWSPVRKLVTSPFMNISTLVRGDIISYDDQTIGIPVYHESAGKFGELLRMNRKGHILAKTRLSHGAYSLQPVIVPLDRKKATGFMRYSGASPERILQFGTEDGGKNWSEPEKMKLPNPNSAVASLALNEKEMLLVFNDTPEGRIDMTLAYSKDEGSNWQIFHLLEFAAVSMKVHHPQYSYPIILQGNNDDIHVLYTYNRESIKHVYFNTAWIREKLAKVKGSLQ